jgi:hypothetical protein
LDSPLTLKEYLIVIGISYAAAFLFSIGKAFGRKS